MSNRDFYEYTELEGMVPFEGTGRPLARKIRGVFRFRYRHKSPRVVQVQC